MLKVHYIGVVASVFNDIADGHKTCLVRPTHGTFAVGAFGGFDTAELCVIRELTDDKGFVTGRTLHATIKHVDTAPEELRGLHDGMSSFSFSLDGNGIHLEEVP